MTALLASVRNLEEAETVMDCFVDILDLKDPLQGALGALSIRQIDTIVNRVNGRIPVSATIGDVSYQADILYPRIKAMAGTGVDIIKVGVFGDVSDRAALALMKDFSHRGVRIVLVLFAEDGYAGTDFGFLSGSGISGVMMDTREKTTGSLRKKISDGGLADFVLSIRKAGLCCGLAGSLGMDDILPLLRLKPDYLGFRGALCRGHRRGNEIDRESVMEICGLMPERKVFNFDQDAITL